MREDAPDAGQRVELAAQGATAIALPGVIILSVVHGPILWRCSSRFQG